MVVHVPSQRDHADEPEATPATGAAIPGSLGRRAFLAGAAGAVVGTAALSSTVHGIEPGASYFQPFAPTRILDTREPANYPFQQLDANTRRLQVSGRSGIPVESVAVVLTVTGVNTKNGRNYVSAYPSGVPWPGTSSLNCQYFDDRVANLVTVRLGTSPNGYIDLRTNGPCDIVVDVAGVYLPTTTPVKAGRYVSIDPMVRVLDTRNTPGKPGPNAVVTVNLNGIVPSGATAVVANLTVVEANAQGFCTAWPLGEQRPLASNINLGPGQTRAVGIMTKLGFASGVTGFNVFTQRGAHIVIDVAGYITGDAAGESDQGLFVPITPFRALDTRQSTGAKKRLWPGWTRAFTLPAPINTRAQAIAMNLTATRTMNKGYFTLMAAQTVRRLVSNLNVSGPDQTVANHAIVRVSNQGVACYSFKGGHIVCDVTGWFTGTPAVATTGVPDDPPPPPAALPWWLSVPNMFLENNPVLEGAPDPIVDAGNTWHWTGTGLVGQASRVAVFGHRTAGPASWSEGGIYRYQHYLKAGDLLYARTADNRLYTYRMTAEYLTNDQNTQILDAATRRVGGSTFALIACTGNGQNRALNRLPQGSTAWRIISVFTLVEWADLG